MYKSIVVASDKRLVQGISVNEEEWYFKGGNSENAMCYDSYSVRLDRSRDWLVRAWEEDSCRDEMIPLTGGARALKSFLHYLQTYQTLLVFQKVI